MKIKTLLTKTVLVGSLALANLAAAANPGAYVGLGLGTGKAQTPSGQEFTMPAGVSGSGKFSSESGGLSGRIFAGYNFNKYFGLEMGYARYATSTYKGSINGGPNSQITFKDTAVDLVAKGYLPIGESGFNVYALGGVARVNQTVNYKNNGAALTGVIAAPKVGTTVTHAIRPVYGVGASYDFNTHFTTNLELTQVYKSGNMKSSTSATPNLNMLTLNVAYNFG